MDTNQYETFEYLQPSNQETLTKRLFVVQENGTYLSLDRTVDLTQVQNVELLEEVQPVYNVSPEQFYIDVDGSQELVRVSEPFLLSNELHEEENIYGNDLMLQQGSSSSDIQIQQPVGHIADNVVEQFIKKDQCTVNNNVNMEVDTASSLTEIIISDEQYKLLQEKGWTLVDNNESIYFIDGFGLHNITNNDQLIQELKEKIRHNNEATVAEKDTSNMVTVTLFEDGYENNVISESTTIPYKEESKDVKIKSSIKEKVQYPKPKAVRILPKPENNPKKLPDLILPKRKVLETTGNDLSENNESRDPKINCNIIKIKTKFSLKDIPSEIVLGKTVNGKKLVARVTKREWREPVSKNSDYAIQAKKPKTYETNVFDHKIEKLIQEAIRSEVSTSIDKEAVENMNRIIQQLLRVPAFKPAVIKKRLIITKISITEDEDHNVKEERGPILITGRVMRNGDKWSFKYVPDMFQKLKRNKESADVEGNKGNNSDINFLQIHIQEVIGPDGNARCSITLNGRVTPCI